MIELRPASSWADGHTMLAEVALTATGAHTGVLYQRAADGELRVLDLAFHFRMRDEPADRWSGASVTPTLDSIQCELIATYCEMTASHLPRQSVPYALRYTDGRFDDGAYVQGNDRGLTCATFVLALVRAATGLEMLDRSTWRARPEDEEAHRQLVETLEDWHQKGRVDRAHVEGVRAEVGCMRYRPEEVAAASATDPRPVEYERAERAGTVVLAELRALFPE